MSRANYNKNGEEILDPTPVAMPIDFKRPIPLEDRIREMTRKEMSLWAQSNGEDSFEEADDFDIEDDSNLIDHHSPWEEDFDPEAKFIGSREAEIRHGVVNDFDEGKIHAGKEELEKLRKLNNKYKKHVIKKETIAKQLKEQSQSESDSPEDHESDENQ